MGLLERAMLPFFPRRAVARLQARIAFDELARAYEAAQPKRGTKNWIASSSSAAVEDIPALQPLRNRSRDLVRNNAWARKARRMLPAHIVGTGVVPRPTEDWSDRTKRRAMQAWKDWSCECDVENGLGFEALQGLAVGTVIEAGEALLVWDPAPKTPGGWNVRVLEPDYLDEGYNEVSRNGSGRVVGGVEFDGSGRRAAYHLFAEHPGDMMPIGLPRAKRVRVEAMFVDHLFERMRPGQVRGVPWLATSMLGIKNLGDYAEAERWRKKIAAALAAFVITNSSPAASQLGKLTTTTDAQGRQRTTETIAPGTIKRLAQGEDVKFSAPPADVGMNDYMRWELFAIAAGIGVPYAELTGDLSNANYSSMRLGKIEFWALLDIWQWNMVRPIVLDRAWRRVMATGGVPGMACSWSFPKRTWVDPMKEIQAEVLAIENNLVSAPDAIAARGDDWRETLAEQAEFEQLREKLGLSRPVPVSAPAQDAPAPDPEDTADAADPADKAETDPADAGPADTQS